jgi:hypothetical protein
MTARAAEGRTRCYAHPQESAVTSCKLCGLAMCDRCYEHDVAGAPACGRCTHEAATRSQRAVSLAISMLGLGGGAVVWAHSAHHLTSALAVLAGVGVVTLASIVFLLVRRGSDIEIEARDRELEREAEPDAGVAHPYRQLARRMALRVSPRVSAGGVTFALIASMLVTAILFSTALRLPRWAEIEVVIGGWWVIVSVVLSTLLYRGYRLRDDWTFTLPLRSLWANDPPRPAPNERHPAPANRSSSGSGCDPGCDPGCVDLGDEGILVVAALFLAAVTMFGALWLLVEVALPVVLFATYSGVLAALKRVAHDRHECEGNLARAVGWGAFWAAFCLLPVAAVVYLSLSYVVG